MTTSDRTLSEKKKICTIICSHNHGAEGKYIQKMPPRLIATVKRYPIKMVYMPKRYVI